MAESGRRLAVRNLRPRPSHQRLRIGQPGLSYRYVRTFGRPKLPTWPIRHTSTSPTALPPTV